jgi:hypothetical protein
MRACDYLGAVNVAKMQIILFSHAVGFATHAHGIRSAPHTERIWKASDYDALFGRIAEAFARSFPAFRVRRPKTRSATVWAIGGDSLERIISRDVHPGLAELQLMTVGYWLLESVDGMNGESVQCAE